MPKTKIVTRDSLQHMLDNDNVEYVQLVIGKALTALYDYQTTEEQHVNSTLNSNGVGFTGADANSGSRTAKFWLKHHTLLDWQVAMWTKKGSKGYARLAKYHKQLNLIAEAKLTSAKLHV